MKTIHHILEDKRRQAGKPALGSDLSARQRQILRFIAAFVAAKTYPPTIREIGVGVGLTSSSTVQAYVQGLREKGYLQVQAHGTALTREMVLTAKACRLLGVTDPHLPVHPPYVLVPFLKTADDIRAFQNGQLTSGTGNHE